MQPQSVQDMASNTTNIVLVHGAWADGSSWNKVIPILENTGHRVIAVQLPLHSLADDIATVKRAIEFPAEAKVMAAVQKPVSQSVLGEKSGPPAWKQLPTWYQISGGDHMIPPDAERLFAEQMNATSVSINASHAVLVSQPDETAQLILNATRGSK
jgi:pimeloyl-ACP methyl ester carboxylesterase